LRSKIQVIPCFSLLSLLVVLSFYSCNSTKETVASRNMQNLTAQFNILFNANELINESDRNIQLAHSDDYDRVISVFIEPNEAISQSELGKLDEAILKANKIANEKSLSMYVDDAYFLIGKSNHLKSNFFNAVEYFNYVYSNYPEEKEIRQAALTWMARSLILSDRIEEAYKAVDTALKYVSIEKKSAAYIYATRAQLHIYAHEDDQAISFLQKAIKSKTNKQNKIRWTYLLAQIQQINGQPKEAYINYSKVLKSNASFEMAFNAKLSAISLENTENEKNKIRQITALLKDSKNVDFHDQIYFQIANNYLDAQNIEKAIENYNNSIASSTKNNIQKALSYQKLAEIYFKEPDYIKTKAYYDSTLLSLPDTYPDYSLIKKKADNIELLADRYSIIAKEDTLQVLAKLPENERIGRVTSIIELELLKAQVKENTPESSAKSNSTGSSSIGNTKFYFNNSLAISQGLIEFKKRWGPRKLEDNWRRSEKSAIDISNSLANNSAQDVDPLKESFTENNRVNIDSLKNAFLKLIPLNQEMLSISDEKIANAMYDIGGYHREVSADTSEAIKIYEQLLNRFPENLNKLAVYYNLYRLYKFTNPQRSENYKDLLLNKFPNSPFAKIILDPDYNQIDDDEELAFNQFYNDVYNLYTSKKYKDALLAVENQKTKLEDQKIPAQLAYLNSLALGHINKIDILESSFKEIVDSNPEDQLIVPLIKLHLAYIDSNRVELSNRVFALLDNDHIDNMFIEEPIYQKTGIVENGTNEESIKVPESREAIVISTAKTQKITEPSTQKLANNKPIEVRQLEVINNLKNEIKPQSSDMDTLFVLGEDNEHYFVVNVSESSVNLSSSRFGIGQFNRVNYAGNSIKHQLISIENQNQLIFVGPINGKEAAKNYMDKISPLMKEIMKIPSSAYSIFYINNKNFEKIKDMETLELYIDFYNRNYNK